MGNGGGDQLARGARSAQFEAPHVTQEEWDQRMGSGTPRPLNLISEDERKTLEAETAKASEEFKASKAATKAAPGLGFTAVQDRVIVVRVESQDMLNGL